MEVFLMNKEKKVLKAEMSDNHFDKIVEVYDISYAPLAIYNASNNRSKSLVKEVDLWFHNRSIPSCRYDLEKLLHKLEIENQNELLLKAFALSLSDQYWVKPVELNINYQDINFFHNDFLYSGFLERTFSDNSNSKLSLISPNNTTDGMLAKAWFIKDDKRMLMKGSFTNSRQEPINEYLASLICERLNILYVKYELKLYNNKLVSICQNEISDNEELISAYDIYNLKKKDNKDSDYMHYVKLLKELGLTDVEKHLSDMFLIDFLMMNYDRHMKNFGVIRQVDSLKMTRFMPIFDTGQSLCCDKELIEINFVDGECKLFNNTKAHFSDLIPFIDLSLYDLNKISDIPELLEKILIKYIPYTGMRDERINLICNGLKYRINYLKKISK